MDISTKIDDERNLRLHSIEGCINLGQLKEILAEFYKSPNYDPEMNVLWDLRKADMSKVLSLEVSAFAEMVKQYRGEPNNKAALLVANRNLDFGLTRMFEIFMEGTLHDNIKVFKDYNEAEKWLSS